MLQRMNPMPGLDKFLPDRNAEPDEDKNAVLDVDENVIKNRLKAYNEQRKGKGK